MAALTVYIQKRVDGGIRSGVELDGETVAQTYRENGDGSNPALLWYVDVRFEGRPVPRDAEKVSGWLLGKANFVREKLESVADDLAVGLDTNVFPVLRRFTDRRSGLRMTVACSSIRRLRAGEIAAAVNDLGRHWETTISGFAAPAPARGRRAS